MTEHRIDGVLTMLVETGVEDEVWAIQDNRHITFVAQDEVLVERWSYEGTHVLETGDTLTVYDATDSDTIVWEGLVRLIKDRQEGVDPVVWCNWFINQHSGSLFRPSGFRSNE